MRIALAFKEAVDDGCQCLAAVGTGQDKPGGKYSQVMVGAVAVASPTWAS